MKKIVLLVLFTVGIHADKVMGQCAMCKATLENNISDGQLTIGSTLNEGILYLFFAPYVLIATVSFFWYRHSKKNAGN